MLTGNSEQSVQRERRHATGPAGGATGRTRLAGSLAGGLIAYALARLAPGLLGLVSIPLWASEIGPSQYGILSMTLGLTSFATALGSGWLRQATLRNAGAVSSAPGRLPNWSVALSILVPAVPLTVWLVVDHNGPADSSLLKLAASAVVCCLALGAFALVSVQLQRDQRARSFALGEATRAAVSLLSWLLVSRLFESHGASSVLVCNAFGMACGIAVMVVRHPYSLVGRELRPDRQRLRSYWRYGWPISLWLALASGLTYIDRFVIDAILGPAAAGHYAAVSDLIIRGMTMLAFPLTMTVHPVVMAEWNAGRSATARRILSWAGKISVGSLLLCVAAMMLAGPWIFGIAIGGAAPSRILLVLLTVGGAVWQYALLAHKPLEIAGRGRLMLTLLAGASTAAFLADLALVEIVGVEGAAAGFTLGAAVYTLACLTIGPKALRRSRMEMTR